LRRGGKRGMVVGIGITRCGKRG
jgi:hypothetical protein